MSSHVITTLNCAGEWEVRAKDEHGTLLGKFKDVFCRDLFVEALHRVVRNSDFVSHPAPASSKRQIPRPAAA